jgi:hypothetical protein
MRRLLVTIVLVLAVASPAEANVASPFTRTDTIGDVGRPKGDITSITVANADTIKLVVRARERTLPSDPIWHDPDGGSFIAWRLYIDAGTSVDWRVRLRGSSTGPIVRVFDSTLHEVPCTIVIGFLSRNRYRLTFPNSCINEPLAFRARATLAIDPPGTPGLTQDLAPNNTTTPFVDF